MSALEPEDFASFFEEVHGLPPFPWQRRLSIQVALSGNWPQILNLPTGSGKTAALDIALFHLALEAGRGSERRAPVRIAFVVDRRLIVDDAFGRAKKLEHALREPTGRPTIGRVAERLKLLSGDGPPLLARRLRGGLPREDDWARTPAQPTILCSTVDQVGSRLLFRGYGVSDRSKPIHAGLMGSDCLILLDEVHLAEPFRQTLKAVDRYRSDKWLERGTAAPWGVAQLSATPDTRAACETQGEVFGLIDEDVADITLLRRLRAAKPTRLVMIGNAKRGAEEEGSAADARHERETAARAASLADETISVFDELHRQGLTAPAIGVVANRVARARAVYGELKQRIGERAKIILMIGPAREIDREDLARELLLIRTGAHDRPAEPLIIVATQTIEAGVDIDLDGLISEAASLDSLRQRFGRLDRDGRLNADGRRSEQAGGRRIMPAAAVVAHPSDLSPKSDDPVYGGAIGTTWSFLMDAAEKSDITPVVDFGIHKFDRLLAQTPASPETLAPKPDAPVLMPAHCDLLSQTAPVPAADPEIALYLHGPGRDSASVTVVWRADVERRPTGETEDIRDRLALMPPRAAEAVELPVWTVRAWLAGASRVASNVADVAARQSDGEEAEAGRGRQAFRWAGADDQRTGGVWPREIRPGDTLVVPAKDGGLDVFGWHPGSSAVVQDVADRAAEPFAGRRFAIRLGPGLLADWLPEDAPEKKEWNGSKEFGQMREVALADALADSRDRGWRTVLAAVLDCDLPPKLG